MIPYSCPFLARWGLTISRSEAEGLEHVASTCRASQATHWERHSSTEARAEAHHSRPITRPGQLAVPSPPARGTHMGPQICCHSANLH